MTDAAIQSDRLPVGSLGRRAGGWYGMLALIMTEGALFAYLLFSYYYFYVQYGRALLPAELPKFQLSLPNTIILLASSGTAWFAERGLRIGRKDHLVWGLAASIGLGIVFMAIQGVEWAQKPFTMASTAYGSLYFTITGFHMAHVAAGLVMLALLLVWSWLDYFDRERNAPLAIGIVYWHFVDAVWLTLFFTFYITPRLG
jgi:cytochrome c oxidase subunit III